MKNYLNFYLLFIYSLNLFDSTTPNFDTETGSDYDDRFSSKFYLKSKTNPVEHITGQ